LGNELLRNTVSEAFIRSLSQRNWNRTVDTDVAVFEMEVTCKTDVASDMDIAAQLSYLGERAKEVVFR
jgi:hypothetical protein